MILHLLTGSFLMCSEEPAWKQSISNTLDRDECISLISRIFLDHNQANMVRHLSGDDAQTFVDVIDEVSSHTILFKGQVNLL